MADGAYRGPGGAPVDPARVEAVRAGLTPAADFGDEALKAVRSCIERIAADARSGELTECSALLSHLRTRLDGLDPKDLVPRDGIAGWFDGHGKRLKRFRDAFADAGRAVADSGRDLAERMAAVERRHGVLEQLIDDSRRAVEELNAHVAAARAWLADHPAPAAPDEGEAPADPNADFRGRVEHLSATALAAVRQLPLVRGLQNAEGRALDQLKAAVDGLDRWRKGWLAGLGLDGRKPRRIRPDAVALWRDREAAAGALKAAEAELAECRKRRSDIERRLEGVRA